MKNRQFLLLGLLLMFGLMATACTGGGAAVQDAIEQAAPTIQAAVEEVAPTIQAAVEEVAPTVQAAVEEVAPTAEAVATEVMEEPMADFEGMSLAAPDCEYGGLFKEIAATDAHTVQFSMCAPDPAFPAKIAFASFAIQSAEYLEATGGTGDILDKPVGTGPYMVDAWNRGEEVVFKRNPNYWGDPAATETLVFRWQTESAARLLELQSGNVDGIDNPGPDDFGVIGDDPNLQLLERPALNVMYVGMNNTYEPFGDVKVRQAIAMSIDRARLVDNFYPPGSEVASHFTPCSIPNGCVGDDWYEFNPEMGRQLLAEAGYPDGFETEIAYRDVVRGYLPDPNIVAQDVQAQLLENLNIKATINVMESGAFLDAADAGSLTGLFLLGWGADYPDQTNFLDYHFGGGSNDSFGDHIPDLVDTLEQAASLAGDDARAPLYEQANNIIRDQVPMIPVAHGGNAVAFQAAVENAHASPLGNEYFAVMNPGKDTFVWMQNAEPISLYCADETDGESLRACEQVSESLLAYEVGGTAVVPALATSCDPNEDLTVWTCNLREGVTFSDGTDFDANDVVETFMVQWDASNPLHVGNTGAFSYFSGLWGGFLNAPPAE